MKEPLLINKRKKIINMVLFGYEDNRIEVGELDKNHPAYSGKGSKGLFSNSKIPANTPLGLYSGIRKKNNNKFNNFAYSLTENHIIDATGYKGKIPYANSAEDVGLLLKARQNNEKDNIIRESEKIKNNKKNNIITIKILINKYPFLVTTTRRNIRAGEESITQYGLAYWLDHPIN